MEGERGENEGEVGENKGEIKEGCVELPAKPKIKKSFIYRVFPTPYGAKSLLNFDFQKSEFLVVSVDRCAGKTEHLYGF